MGKIGDYVHLKWANYMRCGTERDERIGSLAVDLQNAQNLQKQLINNQLSNIIKGGLSNAEIKRLENVLNYMIGDSKTGFGDPSQDYRIQNLRQAVVEQMEEEYQYKLQEIKLDTIDVKGLNLEIKKDNVKTAVKEMKAENNFTFRNIKNSIDKIMTFRGRLIEEAVKKEGTDTYKVNELINKIELEFNRLQKEEGFGQRGKRTIYGSNRKQHLALSTSHTSLIEDINTVCSMINSDGLSKRQKGDILEYVIAATKACMIGESVEGIRKAMKENKKGSDNSFTITNLDFFMDGIDKNIFKFKVEEESENGRYLFSSSSSQGKLDVILDWESKPIRISAKNENLRHNSNNINLVNESPLTYLIQDSNSNFINHYLNLSATHLDDEKSASTYLNEIQTIMKQTLFLKALTGATFGRFDSRANIFIINDNQKSNGGIQVYSVDQLIEKAISNMKDYIRIVTKPQFENIKYNNTFSSSSSQERINNIIKEVYQTKVTVRMTPKILK